MHLSAVFRNLARAGFAALAIQGAIASASDVVPPRATTGTTSATSTASAAVPEPALEEDPVEVTIRGERRSAQALSLAKDELRLIPGAFADPFRALESLPGVTPIISGLPFFYVRGAPPGNAGYFFDGVRIPALYHVGIGPSVVQPALVRDVDVHRGGYPARFGRFAGAVVSAGATPPGETIHGEASLRLYDVGGLIETPFAGGQGSVLAGGRYSYTGALLSLAVPELTLDYRDFQARVRYQLTPRDSIGVFAFSSYDFLSEERAGQEEVLFASEFYRADLRYQHDLDDGELQAGVTLGYDRGGLSMVSGEQRYVVDLSIAARVQLRTSLAEGLLLRAGGDARTDNYRAEPPKYGDPESPQVARFAALFPSRLDLATGLWLELDWTPAPGVDLHPGLRADFFRLGSSTEFSVDPRIAATVALTELLRAQGSFGLAHQPPSFAIPLPGLAPATGAEGLQRTVQGDLGVELDLDAETTASVVLFGAAFFGMTDALGTNSTEADPNFEQRSDGHAFGAELYVKRKLTSRLGGFISYTLSRSNRILDKVTFPSAFDRTHVASLALAYDWGSNWRSGARAVFYSGTPKLTAVLAGNNYDRGDAFFRLDFRVEKRWVWDDSTWISLVFEVLNTTLSKETLGLEDDPIGPIVVPNLGMEAAF